MWVTECDECGGSLTTVNDDGTKKIEGITFHQDKTFAVASNSVEIQANLRTYEGYTPVDQALPTLTLHSFCSPSCFCSALQRYANRLDTAVQRWKAGALAKVGG